MPFVLKNRLRSIVIIAFCLFSFIGYSQSISSKQVLQKLGPYWDFADNIRKQIEDTSKYEWQTVIEQSYGFIIVEIRRDYSIFLRVEYQVQQKEMKIYNFYCAEKKLEKRMKKKCQILEKPFDWNDVSNSYFKFSKEIENYLEIADRIAAKGNDISARPSDFGRIILRSDYIKLSQNNHWNSRSLDHKDSYFMRDLSFKIKFADPSKEHPKKDKNIIAIGQYFIGFMEINFNDGSAKSQQGTGDEILAQLKKEVQSFSKEKE